MREYIKIDQKLSLRTVSRLFSIPQLNSTLKVQLTLQVNANLQLSITFPYT